MGLLTIDEAKCKKDGICAAECPRRIIQLDDREIPFVSAEDEARCMVCGHCVAVCPHGALSVAGVALEDCPEIAKELKLSQEQAEQFLRSRRSIRFYKPEEVDRATIQKLIETARYAPTASNSQTIHWQVISGREKVESYSEKTIDWMREVIRDQPDIPFADYCKPVVAGWDEGYDSIMRDAPAFVVASAPQVNANGLIDVSIALSYLELAAVSHGVGTCWAGLLRAAMLAKSELLASFNLPRGHSWFYPMMIGFPKFKYHRLPERNSPPIVWK